MDGLFHRTWAWQLILEDYSCIKYIIVFTATKKNWYEYLFSFPKSVYLTSTALLDVSQMDLKKFKLEATPLLLSLLKNETLFTDNIRLNLLYMAENIGDSLDDTLENMKFLKQNLLDIKKMVQVIIRNAVSSSEYEYITLIERAIKSIKNKSSKNKFLGIFTSCSDQKI